MRTKGEIEAAICESVGRFEQEYMGRVPAHPVALIHDLLLVRLRGVLAPAQQHLVTTLPAEKAGETC